MQIKKIYLDTSYGSRAEILVQFINGVPGGLANALPLSENGV